MGGLEKDDMGVVESPEGTKNDTDFVSSVEVEGTRGLKDSGRDPHEG